MKKKVSLKDIAQEVGVSTALVSYVLSGKEKEARVSLEMADTIRETAKRLNYQPNQIAKSLKSGKSYTIGLIVADISNPFFANIARTVEDEAKNSGYTAIFGSSDENADKSQHLIDALINRQVDGFIIAPAEHSEAQIAYLNSLNIPFVLIDRHFPELDVSYVGIDNYKATYEATKHLLDNGFKRIGLVVYDNTLVHTMERTRGYEDALREYEMVDSYSLICKVDFVAIKNSIKDKIDHLVEECADLDALLFTTNTLSVEGLKYLNQLGYRIPRDIAVVCFDDSDSFDFFYCSLTRVRQPLQVIAKEAVRILIDQIGNKLKPTQQVIIETQLLVRESSVKHTK